MSGSATQAGAGIFPDPDDRDTHRTHLARLHQAYPVLFLVVFLEGGRSANRTWWTVSLWRSPSHDFFLPWADFWSWSTS